MSRRAASTSAPRPRSTSCSIRSRRVVWESWSAHPRRPSCGCCATASWSCIAGGSSHPCRARRRPRRGSLSTRSGITRLAMGTDLAERSETAGRLRGFGGGAGRVRRAALRQRFLAVLVLWVAIFIYFSLTQSRFFTSANLDALMTSAAVLWMVSIGLTFVMLTGGFDLSLGSLLALTGIALGKLMAGSGVPFGYAGTLTLYGGLVDLWSKSFSTQLLSPTLTALAFNHALGIPIPAWIMLGVFLLALYLQ